MSKRKHDSKWILERISEYLSGQGSFKSIAEANGISTYLLKSWVYKYKAHGEIAFIETIGNRRYSKELKLKCIDEVLSGQGNTYDIAAKYNISSRSVLQQWIIKYNANRELKDYDPKREVYMADARRKTTIEERKEIVKYCIAHDRDYKGTASLYDVSYTQVYSWVRKYDANGEDALIDKRGHHKTDDEVDELERLRRENNRLKRQLEEKDMLVTLLKKVKELEGM